MKSNEGRLLKEIMKERTKEIKKGIFISKEIQIKRKTERKERKKMVVHSVSFP